MTPLVAVTMGDPAGIGPEIVAKTFADPHFHARNRALVVGDAARLGRAAGLLAKPVGVVPRLLGTGAATLALAAWAYRVVDRPVDREEGGGGQAQGVE